MSDSLQLPGLQHTRLLCLPLSPRVHSNSCPLSQWYYLTISSSAAFFSFCLQSFPASVFSNELAPRKFTYITFSFCKLETPASKWLAGICWTCQRTCGCCEITSQKQPVLLSSTDHQDDSAYWLSDTVSK